MPRRTTKTTTKTIWYHFSRKRNIRAAVAATPQCCWWILGMIVRFFPSDGGSQRLWWLPIQKGRDRFHPSMLQATCRAVQALASSVHSKALACSDNVIAGQDDVLAHKRKTGYSYLELLWCSWRWTRCPSLAARPLESIGHRIAFITKLSCLFVVVWLFFGGGVGLIVSNVG